MFPNRQAWSSFLFFQNPNPSFLYPLPLLHLGSQQDSLTLSFISLHVPFLRLHVCQPVRHCSAHRSSLAFPAACCFKGHVNYIMLLWSRWCSFMQVGVARRWPAVSPSSYFQFCFQAWPCVALVNICILERAFRLLHFISVSIRKFRHYHKWKTSFPFHILILKISTMRTLFKLSTGCCGLLKAQCPRPVLFLLRRED